MNQGVVSSQMLLALSSSPRDLEQRLLRHTGEMHASKASGPGASVSSLLSQSFQINRGKELRYNEQRPMGSSHCHQAAGPKENPRVQNQEMGSHTDY